MHKQLTLSILLRDDSTFDNFIAGGNQLLIDFLRANLGAHSFQTYIWGDNQVGKTHILNACCHHASNINIRAWYISLKDPTITPDIFVGVEGVDLICIDDIDYIAGNMIWEEAIFCFYNQIKDNKGSCVFAGNKNFKQLGLKLEDLISRLSWGEVYQIYSLNDEAKCVALQKRAFNKGIQLTKPVAMLLLTRCSRNLSDLLDILTKLDQESLLSKRKLTIPFVKKVLEI